MVEKYGSTCRWLGWSDKLVDINQLDSTIINPSVLGESGSQVWRENVREVGILNGDLRRSLLDNQASSLRFKGWVNTFFVLRILRMITYNWAHFFLTTLPPAPAPLSLPTTSSSSTLKADTTDAPIDFNIAVSDVAILLKSWMTRR